MQIAWDRSRLGDLVAEGGPDGLDTGFEHGTGGLYRLMGRTVPDELESEAANDDEAREREKYGVDCDKAANGCGRTGVSGIDEVSKSNLVEAETGGAEGPEAEEDRDDGESAND